jgi:predicted Zn-dependent peptidase
LSNGLRLILAARPGTPTVAVRAYVRAGSRYDAAHCLPGSGQPSLGLAHLTEHLLFKGTRTRSQRQLFTAIERLGGTLEAGTAKEYLCVSTVVPPAGLAVALEIVAEILGQPSLDAEDFGNEKLVILAEKLRAQDREARILDLFAEALWQEHPLRHPALGTLAGLQAVDHDSLLAFYRQRFVGGNIVLVLCGAFEPQAAESLAVGCFGALPAGPEQDLHQASLLLGVPTVSMGHPDRSALKVIERVLGMGASARLYQRLREEGRLAYAVQALAVHYEDAGYLAVNCTCDPQNLPRARQAILQEWQRLGREDLPAEELAAAQGNYAGTLVRRFETNHAVAGILGVEGLLGQVEPLDAAIGRINAVTPDDVVRVARTYLDESHTVSATIGRQAEPGPAGWRQEH